MPKGSHNYFKQIDPYGGPISPSDWEFAAKVRARIGDEYKDLVDPALAQNALKKAGKYNLLGVNLNEYPSDEARLKAAKRIGLGSIDPKKPVIGVGAGASPGTFAHEYRHQKIEDERTNRMHDLINAGSPAQYASAVQFAYEQMMRDRGEKSKDVIGKDVPIADKEKYVLSAYSRSFPQEFNIEHHMAINRNNVGAVEEFINNPIQYMSGKMEDLGYPRGRIPKSMIPERAKYPFLNFVGLEDMPDAGKYKAGGSIENTTHDRKLI